MKFLRNTSPPPKSCTIFLHIAKTGGTSLKTQFEQSDLKIYMDYDHPPSSSKYFAAQCERRNQEASLLDYSNFDLVFGHFPMQRYQKCNYQYVALLRNPIDRAISQFFYWKNLDENNIPGPNRQPLIKLVKEGKIDFIQYLSSANIVDLYKRMLPPLKLALHFYPKHAYEDTFVFVAKHAL